MLTVAVVGYGYWGPNLVRNFVSSGRTHVRYVVDPHPDRRTLAERRHPGVMAVSSLDDAIADESVDAFALAVPVALHHKLALKALRAKKHVLVEKPIATSSKEALELIALAKECGCTLMVDHTFLYSPAVRVIKSLIDKGELGRLQYLDATRINLGKFQDDVDVFWDLAAHDISIMNYLLNRKPVSVSATGKSHVPGVPEAIGYLTINYEDDLIAHINVNWMAPTKSRRMLVGGDRKMIVYDDLDVASQVKVYDKGITLRADPEKLHEVQISYRTGDMWAPHVAPAEPLLEMVNHFVDCIEAQEEPVTGGAFGLGVISILEAASQALYRSRTGKIGNYCKIDHALYDFSVRYSSIPKRPRSLP